MRLESVVGDLRRFSLPLFSVTTRAVSATAADISTVSAHIMAIRRRIVSFFIAVPSGFPMFCLFIFGSTLMWGEKSLVERIAAIRTPIEQQDLFFKNYCRHITLCWCIFFIVNGSLATITAFWCSDKIWAFYTGFLSYLLIALMFIAEYFYRNRLKSQRSI